MKVRLFLSGGHILQTEMTHSKDEIADFFVRAKKNKWLRINPTKDTDTTMIILSSSLEALLLIPDDTKNEG